MSIGVSLIMFPVFPVRGRRVNTSPLDVRRNGLKRT